jgi:hypothetical protein
MFGSQSIETCSTQNIFFHAAAMLLFHIIQRITVPKFCIFRKSISIHPYMSLLQVALVSIPTYTFVRPPCSYYRLYETENHDFRVDLNGISSTPNLIQIRLAVLGLNHASDRQTDGQTDITAVYVFISCTSCNTFFFFCSHSVLMLTYDSQNKQQLLP